MRSTGLASLLVAVQLAMPLGIAAAAEAGAAAAPLKTEAPSPAAAAPMPATPSTSPVSQPPAASLIVGHADAGRRLYTSLCAYCHRLDDKVSDTGAPGLKGAVHRYEEAWLDRWLADPRGFSDSDARAKALVDAAPYGLVMPRFPTMQDAQNRADVIAFMKALASANGKDDPAAQ